MKSEKELWKFIHEPKVERIDVIRDADGNFLTLGFLLDRIPLWWREEENGANKNEKHQK